MSVDYNALLSEKVQAEYDDFLAGLKEMSAEQIVEHAYEKVFKEDLAICLEECQLEPSEAKALYLQKYPLDYCYREWLDKDCSYMDMLRDTVSDATENAVKEMKDKHRESR